MTLEELSSEDLLKLYLREYAKIKDFDPKYFFEIKEEILSRMDEK
jgi:hypothetical protein